MLTLRHSDIKYGWNCSSWDELYDLAVDPHELRNVFGEPEYAGTLRRMRALLSKWMKETDYQGRGMYTQTRLADDG